MQNDKKEDIESEESGTEDSDSGNSIVMNDDSYTSGTTSSSVTLSPEGKISYDIRIDSGDNVVSVLNKILHKLNGLGESYETLAKNSANCSHKLHDTTSEVVQLKRELKVEKDKTAKLELENVKLRKSHEILDANIIQMESELRKCCLIFDGFAECHEDISVIKSNLYSELNHIPDFYGQAHTVQIKSIEYDGYYRHGYLRPIIVEFHSHIECYANSQWKEKSTQGCVC